MKRLIFILTLACGWFFSQGQPEIVKTDSWKVRWNKKTILETGTENETENTKKIKKTDLNKNYTLELYYKEADLEKETHWNRSFLLFDEKDNQLLKKDSSSLVKISSAELKNAFANKNKIRIYTIAIPLDPELAARVRVRRVHLCTLELQ